MILKWRNFSFTIFFFSEGACQLLQQHSELAEKKSRVRLIKDISIVPRGYKKPITAAVY